MFSGSISILEYYARQKLQQQEDQKYINQRRRKTSLSSLSSGTSQTTAVSQLAIASRASRVDWAMHLLERFEILDGIFAIDLFDYIAIQSGTKRKHIQQIQHEATLSSQHTNCDIKYSDMLFFDDARSLNLESVSQMGVLCCHCPKGLKNVDLFLASMDEYNRLKQEKVDVDSDGDSPWMGYILDEYSLGLTY